jgi:hypothetical protein
MKEATTELLNQKRIKEILKSGGAKTVSAEAVAWIGAVAREAAKNLAQSGRRTPGGRLMAPKMDAGLMARQLSKASEEIAGVAVAPAAVGHEWGPREDWQTAGKRGETKLPFEEWKKLTRP